MRIKTVATLGLASGILALAFSLSIPLANGAPANAPLLQPSPRPTLVPTSAPQATATTAATTAATTVATAAPTSKPHATSTSSKSDDKDDVVHYGRITGTVIDQRTGAPVSHMKVMVGTYALITDVSGNYDLWLPTGSYDVSLPLTSAQGTPVQATSKVTVKADSTVVQHLSFRSAAPAVVVPADVAPAVVADVGVSPAVDVAPVAASVPANAVAPAAKQQPERLPTTGEGDTLPMMIVWLAAALVFLGVMLMIPSVRFTLLPILGMPQANKAADDRLLRRLIGADKKQIESEDESFLNDLLR